MQLIRQSNDVIFIITIYNDYLVFDFNQIIQFHVSFDYFNTQILNSTMVFGGLIIKNSDNGYAEFNLNKIFFNVHDLIDEVLDCMDNIEYNEELEEKEMQNEMIPHQSSLTYEFNID